MTEPVMLPELDEAPKRMVDSHDILESITEEEARAGDRLGRLIDQEDDEDNGLDGQRPRRGFQIVGLTGLQQMAAEMKVALLDHGVGRVVSPWTGRTGGVSIELQAGRGPRDHLWWANSYVARLHHHTASGRITSVRLTPALWICKNGRVDLQGPLCNGYGGGDFVYRIITFGWANHPGLGGPRTYAGKTIPKDNGRPYLWGTEFDWDGVSRWPDEYLEWMGRCDAGLADYWNQVPEAQDEHKGWAPLRKVDRNIITREQSISLSRRYWSTQEEDVDQAQVEEALKNVLHLPDTGLAVPRGQAHNGNLAVNLTAMEQTGANADRAIAGAIAAVKADTSVTGDDEADILAALQAAEERLAALISPPPTTT